MDISETVRREVAMAGHRAKLMAVKSYPRYLWHSLRESRSYRRIMSVWAGFRRYRLISRIISIVAAILTLMGTGAAVLVLGVLCLLVLPLATLAAGGTMLLGLFGRKRQNRRLAPQLPRHTVYLFFPGELESHSYTAATMKELAARERCTVFVVSPYAWSSKGVGGRGFYINARQEAPHLYLLRRHYFFFFRRLLREASYQRIVVIL